MQPESTSPGLPPELAPPAPPAPEPPQPSGRGRSIFSFILEWLIIPAGIVAFLHFFVFQAYHVVGTSMVPTLQDQDYLIISKVEASWMRLSHPADSKNAYIPKRDQVVVFKYPARPSVVFVKRVIGLPGDRVVVRDGKVTVYDKAHPAGFNPDTSHQVSDPITLGNVDEVVPPGNVFVLGDNRTPNGSFDSRDWGFLPSNDIIGTAAFRLWPNITNL